MVAQPLEITVKTLTPLWTGGIDGTMDRLHETGIIGSLRWWYEAVVRGLGGWVCDPTSDNPQDRCSFDSDAYEQAKREDKALEEALQCGLASVCDACSLFGCTGWRRRFTLAVKFDIEKQTPKFWLATLNQSNKFNHWWLSSVFEQELKKQRPFVFSDVVLSLSLVPESAKYKQIIKALLSIMTEYGAIGSKTQYGFGQFDYLEKLSITESVEIIRSQITQNEASNNSVIDLYTFQNFWQVSAQIPENASLVEKFKKANVVGDKDAFVQYKNKYLPVSFDLRYKLPGNQDGGLRQNYRTGHGKKAARQIFGTLKDDKRGSRVFVSHLYKVRDSDSNYNLRVWGFTEDKIGTEVQNHLKELFPDATFKMTVGREILNTQRGDSQ